MRYLVLLLTTVFVACAPVGEMIQNAGEPTAKTESTTEKAIDQYQLEPYDGPKARVAVYRFEDQTAKGGGVVRGGYPGHYWYNPQIGNGMADMLNDALLKSDRFIVLERQALKDVLQEQDLAASGRVSKATGAAIGEIEGADLLIKGSVTEFEPGSAGAGGFGALGYFGLPGLVAGAIASGVRQSHVAMIIQVVDAKTSRLLFSTNVEGKANDFHLGGLLGGFGGSVAGAAGLGTWQKTPVEKAIRIAILEAVKELSKKTPKTYFRHGAQGTVATPTVTTTPVPTITAKPREMAPPTKPAVISTPESFKVDAQRIRDAQSMLKQAGFDPGPVDGAWGNKTRTAVSQFQTTHMNLDQPTGQLDEATFLALKQFASAGMQSGATQTVPQTPTQASELPSVIFVKVKMASLLDAPGPEGKTVAHLNEGARLSVQADDKDCYFVATHDGKTGWIYKFLTKK